MTAKLSKGDKQLQTVVYIQDLITKSDSDLGSTDLVTHGIDAGDRPAIDQPPRRLPLHYSGMWRWWSTKILSSPQRANGPV